MKKVAFDKLVASIRQAGSIRRAESKPSREFRFAPTDVKAIRAKLGKCRASSHS